VGVQGDDGFSSATLLFILSAMARLFHLLTSSSLLDTELRGGGASDQDYGTPGGSASNRFSPFQIGDLDLKPLDLVLQLALLQLHAGLDDHAPGRDQPGVEVLALQD